MAGRALVMGKFWTVLTFFTLLAMVGLIQGRSMLTLISLMYIGALFFRIPDTWQEVVTIEFVGTAGMLLAIISGPLIAMFYVFTAQWITRFVSPFGSLEDYNDTFIESSSYAATILLSPILITISENVLLSFMLHFMIVKFIITQFLNFFIYRTALITEFFYDLVSLPFEIFQSQLLLSLFGLSILSSFGVDGWTLGSLDIISKVI